MLRTYKIEGIVIKRINFSEADKLLSIFTKTLGKIVVLAKGIRKIHSRKAAHLEMFNNVSLQVASGRSIDIVTEAQTLRSFPNIRKHLPRLALAYQVAEEIDRLCPERETYQSIYLLLLWILKHFDVEERLENPIGLVDYFTRFLLVDLGFLPRDNKLTGDKLNVFLEQVMERKLKSNSLLIKLLDRQEVRW